MYAIAPLIAFDMSIYSIIIAAVAPSTFLLIYFEFIFIPLILSVISSIIIVLVVYYY
jgi:hypothetical protein